MIDSKQEIGQRKKGKFKMTTREQNLTREIKHMARCIKELESDLCSALDLVGLIDPYLGGTYDILDRKADVIKNKNAKKEQRKWQTET